MTKEKRCARAGGGSPGRPPQLHLFTYEPILQNQLTIKTGKEIIFTYAGGETWDPQGVTISLIDLFYFCSTPEPIND